MENDLIDESVDTRELSLCLLKEHKELSGFNLALKEDNTYLRTEVERLSFSLLKFQRAIFGPSSEKDNKQRSEPITFDEEDTKDIDNDLDEADSVISIKGHTRKKHGLSKDLPRKTIVHELDGEQALCSCGCELSKIGEDKYEQLNYIPAVLEVTEHIKYKYACKNCSNTIRTAKPPTQPIPKSIATPGLLAYILVSKYRDHLPLYRQEQMLASIGANLPRSLLSRWMVKVGNLITPLINLLKEKLLDSNYIQADETPVQVLNEKDKSATSKSYIWLYKTGIDENGIAIYEYQPNRKSENAEKFLNIFLGHLQADGYAGYDRICSKDGIVRLGCLAHARRKFIDIAKSSKGGKAETAVNFIKKLYKIESNISSFTNEKKLAIRQEKSKPLMMRFIDWLKDLYPKCPPKGNLAIAINYTLEREASLTEYLNHGHLNIDNNLAENKIRPFALGRKNWLFMGNEKSANASCNIYSLLETAKMNGHDIYNYFKYILEKIPISTEISELEELLPMNLSPESTKPGN